MNLDQYIVEINRFKKLASELAEDEPAALIKKIEFLSKCHVLVGEVSAEYDRRYKLIHVKRDQDYAKAYIDAPRPKKEHAELATMKIRNLEAEYYGLMMKYRNDFESLQELIHYLKLRMKVDFADGTIGNRYKG